MNNFSQDFYDPLSVAFGGDMTKLQPFIDDVLALKYNKLQIDGFTFENDLKLDFTFSQLEKEYRMNCMASYVDVDAQAKPIAHEGQSAITGSIPRMKEVEYYNEAKLRNLAIMDRRSDISKEKVRLSAQEGMFEIFDSLIGRHTNSLTYQRHQFVSAGKLELNSTNNQRGITTTIYAQIPATNKTTKTGTARWWTAVSNGTYSSEGSACDPIADLKAMVKKLKAKGVNKMHFEVQESYLEQVLAHSKIVAALQEYFSLRLTYSVSTEGVALFEEDARINALGSIIGAPIVKQDYMVESRGINLTDVNSFFAFNDNVFVLVPDGDLGTILTVEPLALAGGEYGRFLGDKGLITISKDYSKKTMAYESELTSLVVPDKPRYMFYLHPYSAN